MLYKVDPMGYFGRVQKFSRGPWFNEWNVEEDGLEYFYSFAASDGLNFLLSNNVPVQDRERLQRLYYAHQRNSWLAWFGGLWVGVESVSRCSCFRQMAIGWRVLSLFGTAWVVKTGLQFYNGRHYGPIFAAYMRKYQDFAKTDLYQITDRKREYFDIDTSQYMNYTNEDLGHDYHANHGPQPDGEALDSSWLAEVDKFLRGEDNKMKEHKNFVNYTYEFIDKSYPTAEAAHELFHKPAEVPKRIF